MTGDYAENIAVILDTSGLTVVDPLIAERDYFYSSSFVTDEKILLCMESGVSNSSRVGSNIAMLKKEGRMIERFLRPENRWLNRVILRQIFGSRPILTEYHSAYDDDRNRVACRKTRKKLVIDCRFMTSCLEFAITSRSLVVIATTDKGVVQIIDVTLNSLNVLKGMLSCKNEDNNDLLNHICENLRICTLSDLSLLSDEPAVLRKWASEHRSRITGKRFCC